MEQNDHRTGSDDSAEGSAVSDASTAMQPGASTAPQLSAIELRILGALMEKQLTTPDGYPLTLNSIATACNQKSSREPISNYQQGELKRALIELEDKKFVHQEYGSRAEKFTQHFIKYLELGKKQQALLCVMMLRGPQTVSELDTRTQRMCDFTDREDLEHCIARLCDRETPYAIRLGQQPGQRGERVGHLFCGMPSAAARQVENSRAANAVAATTESSSEPSHEHSREQTETIELLQLEIADLQGTVQSLKTETAELRQQIQQLYRLTGNAVASDPSAQN